MNRAHTHPALSYRLSPCRALCLVVFLIFLYQTAVFSFPLETKPDAVQSVTTLQAQLFGVDQQQSKHSERVSIHDCLTLTVPTVTGAESAHFRIANPPQLSIPSLSSLLVYTQTTSSHL
jgi:hypothetical protein